MTHYVVTDPRGITVIVPESTLTHAAKHRDDLGGKVRDKLIETVTAPDRVLANPQSFRSLERHGNERYERHDLGLGCYLLVPAKEITEPIEVRGYGTVSSGRIALSVFSTKHKTVAKVLWSRST